MTQRRSGLSPSTNRKASFGESEGYELQRKTEKREEARENLKS